MEIKFINWNINKGNYNEIKEYLDDIIKKENPTVFTFFESENLMDSHIESLGYSKISLNNAEPSKKVIKLFLKKTSNYTIINKYNFTQLIPNEIKKTTLNNEAKNYIIEESKIITRIEKVSTLEAFEIKNINTDETFLYVALHIPSKLINDEYDQLQAAANYKKYITAKGEEYDNRILVAGDFNMAPFERGMTEPLGFFTFQNKKDVKLKIENINGGRQLSFYNPCWSLLGDYNKELKTFRSGGSFFYKKSRTRKKKTWHLFDQIIITKKLCDLFDNDSLHIFENNIILNDIQDINKSIDHLPLCFNLKI